MKRILLMLVCLYFSYVINAQVTNGFNYQAIIRNNSGVPIINQQVALKIGIIRNTAMGTISYQERQTPTTNSFGMVNIVIGNGTHLIGNIDTISWGITKYFIKLDVDVAGGTNYTAIGTTQLQSVPYAKYAENSGDNTWYSTGNNIFNKNIGNVGIGTSNPNSKLEVKGTSLSPNDTLFQVKDNAGKTVFAVYPYGAQIYVDDNSKSAIGGFAVSGRSTNKASNNDYFLVTPDSVRVYLNETSSRAAVGGFAVSGKSTNKATNNSFFSVSIDTNELVNPSVSRILWYPKKEAFFSGRVLVEAVDSVGLNSWASGYEAKAIGNWSQSLGYKSIARGNYSTAIGKEAIASGLNSFAFGSEAIASGNGSYALGSVGRDTVNNAPNGRKTIASNTNAIAIGLGAQATGSSAFALGSNNSSSGNFSTSLGFSNTASGKLSIAMGNSSQSIGDNSFSAGYMSKATGSQSVSIGSGYWYYVSGMSFAVYNNAVGSNSFALGFGNNSYGNSSMALGVKSYTYGDNSIAAGNQLIARAYNSFVVGAYNVDAGSSNSWVATDPLFVVGNGSYGAPSNAITVLKNGLTGINTTNPLSRLQVNGSISMPIVTITSATYTLAAQHHTLIVNTAGNCTVNLPQANTCYGRIYVIKKINAVAYTVTIDPYGSELIDSASTNVFTTVNKTVVIQSNGNAWWIIN